MSDIESEEMLRAGRSDKVQPGYWSSTQQSKWSITVNDSHEAVYVIGFDVDGNPRYKILQRYRRGPTERIYGIGPERRLRIRAPDAKAIAEIFGGYNYKGNEDWRPIRLKDYDGLIESLEPEIRPERHEEGYDADISKLSDASVSTVMLEWNMP